MGKEKRKFLQSTKRNIHHRRQEQGTKLNVKTTLATKPNLTKKPVNHRWRPKDNLQTEFLARHRWRLRWIPCLNVNPTIMGRKKWILNQMKFRVVFVASSSFTVDLRLHF